MPKEPRPTLVAVFADRYEAEKTVDELEQAGFTPQDVGFALRGSDVIHGGMISDAEGAKDVKGAAGGAIAGAAVGGIFGAMMGLGVSEEEARFYEKEFNSGKAIVAVKPGNRFAEAVEIPRRRGGYTLQARPISPVPTEGLFSEP